MKSSSLWGPPPYRFYKFLLAVKQGSHRNNSVAILGCADGRYVLPAAHQGLHVLAIYSDRIALFGGKKVFPFGVVKYLGLEKRLISESLHSRVKIVNDDFIKYLPSKQYGGVFISGALQYRQNIKYDLRTICAKIADYVAPRGFLLLEYMADSDPRNDGLRHCPSRSMMNKCWDPNRWRIIIHRIAKPTLETGHIEHPTKHLTIWARLFVQRRPDKSPFVV